MLLYKYISFTSSYWKQPLELNALYFATVEELRGVNDAEEFVHDWTNASWYMRKYGAHSIRSAYDHVIDGSRTLCLTANPSAWSIFCPDGGVCYTFRYDKGAQRNKISFGDVQYGTRIKNPTEYMIAFAKLPQVRQALRQVIAPDDRQDQLLRWWSETDEPRKIMAKHLVEELTFKKPESFKDEQEYRFVHPINPTGEHHLRLKDSRFTFEQLGLKLESVRVTDEQHQAEAQLLTSLPVKIHRTQR